LIARTAKEFRGYKGGTWVAKLGLHEVQSSCIFRRPEILMKAKIHPEYVDAVIHCACGNIIKTKSTRKDMRIGICSKCHPFFTGTQKFVDTAGRVERFQKRYGKKTTK
jgi:large subunit ribosomal protein L31